MRPFRVLSYLFLVVSFSIAQSFAAPAAKKSSGQKPLFKRASSNQKFPQKEQLGVGLYVGLPIGITGKYWLENDKALDLNISGLVRDYFNISMDQVWHFPGYFGRSSEFVGSLSPYVGVGGGLYTWSDSKGPPPFKRRRNTTSVHARFPVGAEWLPHPAWGVFVELVPGIAVLPAIRVVPELGIGLRVYL